MGFEVCIQIEKPVIRRPVREAGPERVGTSIHPVLPLSENIDISIYPKPVRSVLACMCGGNARFERVMGPGRRGYPVVRRERLVCPDCGRATPWEPASPNGEHRQQLVYDWDCR